MTKTPREPDNDSREARLKAALRANLARRKAQGRARASDSEAGGEQHGAETPPDRRCPNNED
ncbi:hypothetical protein [Paracoccus halophilus]|uniref:hypothetical protein n=1 Tax=Paracoccus halophilus TaxID=376733 RepID=UPI0009458BFF|nr:hypothetical protein [Paracoccus halophilus]